MQQSISWPWEVVMNGLTVALGIAYLGLLASNSYAIARIENAVSRKRAKSAMALVVTVVSIVMIVHVLR